MKTWNIGFAVVLVIFVTACKEKPSLPPQTTRFQPGQEWSFHGPTNMPKEARLTVARVDYDPEVGPIIWASFSDLQLPYVDNYFMPLSDGAMQKSVLSLEREGVELSEHQAKDFESFYSRWERGLAAGEIRKCFQQSAGEVLTPKYKQPRETGTIRISSEVSIVR